MRIHRLRLSNFRGVTEREVHFPDAGVVVLQGENEVGKTSMIEAIDLLLDKADSSRAKEVRAVKPVDRDVGPLVEAELTCGPYRFTYLKQWLRETRTELRLAAPRTMSLTGAEAHARVRQILDETLDTSLYQALRVLQASELTATPFGASSTLSAALDRAAGTAGHDDDGDALLEAVNTEYAQYFTATGKRTGAYASAERDLADAEQAHSAARQRLAELAQQVGRHATLRAELTALTEGLDVARREAKRHEATWQHLAGLREQVSVATQAVRDRRRDHALLSDAAVQRHNQDRSLAEKVSAWEQLTARLVDAREQLHHSSAAHRGAKEEVAIARADEQRLLLSVESATRAAERLQDLADLQRTTASIDAIARAQATIDECEANLADSRIDADLVAKIDEADTELAVSRAQHEAAAARLHVQALTPLDVQIDGTSQQLAAEAEIDHAVTDQVTIELADTLRISVSPARSTGDTDSALTEAQRELAELLRTAGTSDRRAAHRMLDAQRRTLGDLDRARDRLAEELDGAAVGDLHAERARLHARLSGSDDAIDAAEPDADPREVQRAREAATEAYTQAHTHRSEVEAVLETTAERTRRLELDCTLLEGKASMAEGDINDQRTALATEREKTPDTDLDQAADEAGTALTEAQRRLAGAEAELSASPAEQIEAARTNATALVTRLSTEASELEDELRRVSVSLEFYGREGLQGAYDTTLSDLEAAQGKAARIDRRAQASRLLHETLHRARRAARSRYISPFRDQVVALGKIVYGSDFDVEIGEDLAICTRTLAGRTVEFDQLSAGAREQLAIISRLACAAVVDPDQGVPVIIDDALGYSDPARLAAMNTMIGALATDAQIILLTCTPDRYRSIGSATVIRLEPSLPATG